MTWVVGMPGLPVGAIAVSDVCVSFCDPDTGNVTSTWEGVQKIHEVAPNILMGFAGSIYLGFKCVADFSKFVGPNPTRRFVHLDGALADWSEDLRAAWRNSRQVPPEEAKSGCQLLFLSVHPTENVGGMSSWPVTSGLVVRAPDFDIEEIRAKEVRSIGSGSQRPEYLEELEGLASRWVDVANFASAPVGGLGHLLVASTLQDALQRTPLQGVGASLHTGSVTRDGGVHVSALQVWGLGSGIPSLTMPPVARTWNEFLSMTTSSMPAGVRSIG